MCTEIYKTLDLFAGIGGIRKGFESAQFETVFANDFDDYCKQTYDLNYKTAQLFVEDIQNIKSKSLPDFDVLLAGFPCQPFSVAGDRRGFLDGRGNLFFEIIRILRDKEPNAFLLENVKNLKTHDKGRTFEVIADSLKKLGYHIKDAVLNSMEYGNVPQNRERVYIAGFKSKTVHDSFKFPEKVSLTNSIANILETSVDAKYYYNDNNTALYKTLKEAIKLPNVIYQYRRVYVRENKSGVCPTLTANMGMGGHNVPLIKDEKGIRKLTPRECASLQGFPKDYKLPKDLPDTQLYKQLGNSVTVSVIKRIAEQMMKALNARDNYVYREPAQRTAEALRTTS